MGWRLLRSDNYLPKLPTIRSYQQSAEVPDLSPLLSYDMVKQRLSLVCWGPMAVAVIR